MGSAFQVFGGNARRTVVLDCLPLFDLENRVTTTVDFGSTNHTLEILAVKGVDLIGLLPDAVQLNSLFAAGIGATTQHREAAQALIGQLCTEHAARIMRENRLTPAAP